MNRILSFIVLTLVAVPACKSADAPQATGASSRTEHSVIIHFRYGQADLEALHEAEDELEAAIQATAAGELDGHEIASSGADGSLYLYGPDGDRLYAAVRPVLEKIAFMRGAEVTVRYGPPTSDARERTVVVGRGSAAPR